MFSALVMKNDLVINTMWLALPAEARRRLILMSGGDVGRLTLKRVVREAVHVRTVQQARAKVEASVLAAVEAA